jgi:hypothetical protein
VLSRTCGTTLAPPAARDSDVEAPRSTAIETMPSFGQEVTRMPGGPDMTLERVIERAIEHAVLGGELGGREFIRRVGASPQDRIHPDHLRDAEPMGFYKKHGLDVVSKIPNR